MRKSEEISQLLGQNGHKKTRYRIAILELLEENAKPLSVLKILELLAEKKLDPNKTTVYRELDYLVEHGMVKSLDLGESYRSYEIADKKHHHHLICRNCKNIEDVYLDNELIEIEKYIECSSAFRITGHALEFYGLCKRCQL